MHPFTMAVVTTIVSIFGFVLVGPLIGFFFSVPFFNGDFFELMKVMTNPAGHPEARLPLYVMQGCATLIGLGLIPLLLSFGVFKKGLREFFAHAENYWQMFLVVLAVTISFMAVNSFFIYWNAHFQFPEFLQGFESWAHEYEDRAEELTKFMTQFSSDTEFLVAFVVIAILPAIGEEFVFRGMLQSQLFNATRNIHIAIWTSAILFSAFHLQFFGFVPRMLLGALFGYLYYWSGNLWMPMFAHFVNNGFSVVALYLNQKGVVDVDVESTDVTAPWPAVIIFALVTGALLIYYKNFFTQKKMATNG
jgi:membrane protease YdiL (CAAX protease family)